ncbi:unnamed protein product [Brachionus calyciflorus]|uniref:Uncharacterized protein n=1 Tax=Brachionus calyciflorus TaxID=104777 RepID=A0A814P9R7_9BILA|nr:unnamed protein product [Brachionus calyciflorus]
MSKAVLIYGFKAPEYKRIDLEKINGVWEFAGYMRKGYGGNFLYGVDVGLKYHQKISFKHVDVLAEHFGEKADFHLGIGGNDYDHFDEDSIVLDEEIIKKVSEALKETKIELEKLYPVLNHNFMYICRLDDSFDKKNDESNYKSNDETNEESNDDSNDKSNDDSNDESNESS